MGGFGSGKTKAPQTATPRSAQVEEILKCGKDPIYFTKKYCKIQHPTRGTVPFETFPFQDRCLKDFVKHSYNIVLKSRQLGLSTITAAYATWLALFRRDKNILVIASKLRTAKTFIRKVRKFLSCLPPWLRLVTYEESQQEVRFDNGSQICAIPTSDDAGRSEALSLLIVDEAAIIRNLDEIWGSLFPTLSEGGAAIVLSTPFGVGGKFFDLWMDAKAGRNGFNTIELPWEAHPEHDQEWFEKQSKKLGPRLTSQELKCEFLSSGETFLQTATMQRLGACVRLPNRAEGVDANLWTWQDPIPGRKYILASDVSRGDARDFSTFVVLDAGTGEIAVEYQGKVFPDILAEFIDACGRRYNNALVCVEANTFGSHCIIELKKRNYPNLFYQTAPKHSVENFYPSSKDKAGFTTQAESRMQALVKFEDSLRTEVVTPASSRFYEELKTFVWLDEKPQAKKGKHDDLVMAVAIACWILRTYFEDYRQSFSRTQSNAPPKPLSSYMSVGRKTFNLPARRPPGPPRDLEVGPGSFVRTDRPMSPQAAALDPRKLRWLI